MMKHTDIRRKTDILRMAAMMLMVALCGMVASAHDFEVGGVYYNILNAFNEVEVASAPSGTAYSGTVTIPEQVTHNNKVYNVTAVGDRAFADCPSLEQVTFGGKVATIGKRAFLNCTGLTQMTIPQAVALIKEYAFAQCTSLNTVVMNNDAPLELGTGAFMGCQSLEEVNWASSERLEGKGGVAVLGTGAFMGCSSLQAMLLPGTIEHLGTGIFGQCPQLESLTVMKDTPLLLQGDPFALDKSQATIYVPTSGVAGAVASLYNSAVGWRDYNIAELPYSFIDNNGYTYVKDSSAQVTLTGRIPLGNEVVVRESIYGYNGEKYNVAAIASTAFKNTGIKTFDSSHALKLKTIGAECFAGCTQLAQVSIIDGVTTMGERAFAGCTALTQVELPSTLQLVPHGAFENCTSLASVNLVLGVAIISENAFAHCTSLSVLNLPRSLAMVEHGAFKDMPSLEQVNVESQCYYYTSLEGVLFELKRGDDFTDKEQGEPGTLVFYPMRKPGATYYLPCGMVAIEPNAIENVVFLKNLAIPGTTTQFGDDCFKGTSLEKINYRNSEPSPVASNALNASLKASTLLQVPTGAMPSFLACETWQDFANIEERYDVYHNDNFAYDWNTQNQMTIVDIKPAAVNSSGVLNLTKGVKLSSTYYTVTELGNTSTAGVASLVKSLNFNNDSLAVINTDDNINPLSALSALENISAGSNSLYFKVVDGVLYNKRGTSLYYYLRSKTNEEFALNNVVDTIMPQAFAHNEHLKRVTFNAILKGMGGGAFEDCKNLQQVDNAISIETLDARAFAQCTSLTTFNGGERLIIIGDEAFLGCKKLNYMPLCHGVVQRIGDHAFKGCEALKTLVVCNVLKHMGNGAFEDCKSLEKVFFTAPVTNLGQQVFKGCTSLRQLWLCNETPPEVGNDYFSSQALSQLQLHVPSKSLSSYQSSAPWRNASQVLSSDYVDNGADVNNDNAVTSMDITLVYSYLLGVETNQHAANFDVNHDGAITSGDITFIYDIILHGTTTSMAYSFLQTNHSDISHDITMSGSHERIMAIDNSSYQPIGSGLSGLIDNTAVAQCSMGSTGAVQHIEIVPLAPGYCTLVAIVTSGSMQYYRAFALTVSQ